MNKLFKKYTHSVVAWLAYGSVAVWVTLGYVLPEFPSSDLGSWGFLQYPVAFLAITLAAGLAFAADKLLDALFQNALQFAQSTANSAVQAGQAAAGDVSSAVSDSKKEFDDLISKLNGQD